MGRPNPTATSRLVLVVVGSGPLAEMHDRPLAYALARRINALLDELIDGPSGTMQALVCSDLWYLNDPAMRDAPTISIGGPDRNALTAHLSPHLSRPIGEDGRWVVQTPAPEGTGLEDLAACLWGENEDATARAVAEFIDGLLSDFVDSAVRQASGG